MSTLTITPQGPLRGTIRVPGDKSITHRALLASALAEGSATIAGYCRGEDCLNTLHALQALGVDIEVETDQVRVRGKGLNGLTEPCSRWIAAIPGLAFACWPACWPANRFFQS